MILDEKSKHPINQKQISPIKNLIFSLSIIITFALLKNLFSMDYGLLLEEKILSMLLTVLFVPTIPIMFILSQEKNTGIKKRWTLLAIVYIFSSLAILLFCYSFWNSYSFWDKSLIIIHTSLISLFLYYIFHSKKQNSSKN